MPDEVLTIEEAADDASENDDASKKDKGPKLAAVLAHKAWELTARGSEKVRCLVFCN